MSSADYGLLSPIWAGRPVALVTGDPALVDAMIEAEVALARAQGVPVTPGLADAEALAARTRDGGNPVTPLLATLDDPRLHHGATSQDILDTALMLVARRALALTAIDLDSAIDAAGRLASDHRDTPMAARTLTQQAVPTAFGLKAAGWRHLLIEARRAVRATITALPAQLGGAAGTLASFVAIAAVEQDAPDGTDAGSLGIADRTSATDSLAATGRTSAADTDALGAADRASTADAPLVRASAEAEGSLDSSAAASSSADRFPAAGAATQAHSEALVPAADSSALGPGIVSVPPSPADSALSLVSRFARRLNLAEPLLPWHVLRTPIADLASTLALAAGAMGKVAADVLVLSRTEIGEVAEGVGGVSSTMPHKANPVRAALVASAARQVPALASVLFASVAAEDERPAGAWHAEWQPLREALRLVGGAAATTAELLSGLRVHPERMAANLASLDLAEARRFVGRDVSDPREYLGAASALVDRALKENP